MLASCLSAARAVLANSARLYAAALAAVIAAVAAFFLLSYAATFADQKRIVAHLEEANAGHVFRETYAPWTRRALPRFSANDCGFFLALLQTYPSRLSEAISIRIPPYGNYEIAPGDPTNPGCLQLIWFLDRPEHASPDPQWYHRYLHGQRLFAKAVLMVAGPDALGRLTLTLNVALLLGVLLAGAWRARSTHAFRDAAFAAVAAAMLLFDGLWLFGIYYSHGVSDLVLSGFLAIAYFGRCAAGSERGFAISVSLYGVATALTEYLTGGIPFGVALLLGVIAIDGPSDPLALARRAVHGGIIFASAILLTFVIKIALVMLLVDQTALADFSRGISTRVGSRFVADLAPQEVAFVSAYGIDLSVVESHWTLTVLYMLARVAYASFVIGYGSPIVGVAVLGGSALLTVALLVRRFRGAADDATKLRLAIVLASALVMPVWSIVFLNHTLLHAIWMVRPFGWTVAAAGILLCWPRSWLIAPAPDLTRCRGSSTAPYR